MVEDHDVASGLVEPGEPAVSTLPAPPTEEMTPPPEETSPLPTPSASPPLEIAGFAWLPEETFTCGGQTRTAAVYRNQERAADRYALELTQEPGAFRRALLKVAAANLEPWTVPGWVVVTSASHPRLADRVARADAATVGEEADD